MKKSIINGNELAESTILAIETNFDYISRDGKNFMLYKNTLRVHEELLCIFHQCKDADVVFVVFDKTP